MLDSDGFAMLDLDDCNIDEMTLEEKILTGFYTAKPTHNEKYSTALLNRPNPPTGKEYNFH